MCYSSPLGTKKKIINRVPKLVKEPQAPSDGKEKSEAESGRQHGAEARSIPGWLATDPFSGVAGLLNRWAAPVFWEAFDEKVTPLLMEDAVESVKLRGAKLELKAAGQVGWLFLSALRTVYRKTLTQDAEIRKLRDEVAALQERQLHMKETIESAVNRGDQMEARCTALAVRVAKQKSRQKPKVPSAVQVRALVRKENWDPCTWDEQFQIMMMTGIGRMRWKYV
ncbi:hypothetical protein NDU88_001434 [Pleurodeles waltl]|uniref:Uncharacterized protein n=1 Tax=Pleurodeles waltl TaxID=8319 RepID=A0AAV7W1H6_PLEWA|nr:hypothetical protein NDU88_001434 [Pleurodeles waltl]